MFLPLRAAQALRVASKGEVGRGMGICRKQYKLCHLNYGLISKKGAVSV